MAVKLRIWAAKYCRSASVSASAHAAAMSACRSSAAVDCGRVTAAENAAGAVWLAAAAMVDAAPDPAADAAMPAPIHQRCQKEVVWADKCSSNLLE